MDVACPQCGNPNLDVDAQNNVVYCRKCGFAVQVDPATGNVTPLSGGAPSGAGSGGVGGGGGGMQVGGGAMGGAMGGAPGAYAGGKTILGLEPFTFTSLGIGIVLLLSIIYNLDLSMSAAGIAVFLAVYVWAKLFH
ncbi:MAG: hypothetical protein V1817_04180 [Candidatus Micrarchaeota archaeon]